VVNLKRAIAELKEAGFWVIGTSGQNGDLLWQADLTGRLAVVIGSEGKGMRPGVAAACDRIMRVPLQGRINSLNASVSAGVILFEILRQNQERLKPGI
jgi:23S rRNA (guanosine2251-2'-O)-methyltransferase